jgi:competence protein ComFC
MVKINAQKIEGAWRVGFALDVQTVNCEYIGDYPNGRPRFDTVRSEIGELLYQLKYHKDISVISTIVDTVVQKAFRIKDKVDCIIPVPPSNETRTIQPVIRLAQGISQQWDITLHDCVIKNRVTPMIKEIPLNERRDIKHDLYSADKALIEGKRILLFDDIYETGATMSAITDMLYAAGATDVLALTITKNRKSN